MVVLTSMHGNESRTVLRRNKTTTTANSTITLNYSQSCYQRVEAFDVESDGTVGSLPVPGMLLRDTITVSEDCTEKCKTYIIL